MTSTGNKVKIDYMADFMTAERFSALKETLGLRTRYMTVCMENTFHPQNASALVRSCEAFGIQDIHTVETLCNFSPNVRIVRGTDKWVDIYKHPDSAQLIAGLKTQGYRIVATSPHADGSTPETFDVAKGKFALFFGTEHEGISPEVEKEADEFIRIPMYGFVESLNVSASAAILLYILSTRVRNSGVDWELAAEEKEEILLRWMMASVRDSKNIMKRLVTKIYTE